MTLADEAKAPLPHLITIIEQLKDDGWKVMSLGKNDFLLRSEEGVWLTVSNSLLGGMSIQRNDTKQVVVTPHVLRAFHAIEAWRKVEKVQDVVADVLWLNRSVPEQRVVGRASKFGAARALILGLDEKGYRIEKKR
jgi:hypothetical protein